METILVFRMQQWECWSVKLEGILQAAERRGWNMQTIDAPPSLDAAREILDLWKPRGCIVVEGESPNILLPPKLFNRTPVVYLDQATPPANKRTVAIKHDAKAITKAAFKELISIGCTAFAYVGWTNRVHWSEDKRQAFEALLKLHGNSLLAFTPDEQNDGDYTLGLNRFVSGLPHGCGILAVNDIIAARVIASAKNLGRGIPDDLALIGVNNDPICQTTNPTLSSFALDFAAIGEAAIRAIERPGQARRGQSLIPPLNFIRRRSTMRMTRQDRDVVTALERIRREACSGVSAKDILGDFKCSRRMAEIKFKNKVGHSVLSEIQRIRLDRVCELLKMHDIPLTALADRCGFRSAALLQRQFKSRFDCTPRQWRKQLYPISSNITSPGTASRSTPRGR